MGLIYVYVVFFSSGVNFKNLNHVIFVFVLYSSVLDRRYKKKKKIISTEVIYNSTHKKHHRYKYIFKMSYYNIIVISGYVNPRHSRHYAISLIICKFKCRFPHRVCVSESYVHLL